MTVTDLSNAADRFGPYLFPPLFILLWIGVCHFVASRAGWKDLASVYTSTAGFIGTRYYFQSARMRGGMNYNNMLTVGTDMYALYLSVFPLLRIGHSPVCIPWREISAAFQKGFFGKSVKLELQQRAHSLQLAAGLASESKNGKLPYSRRFPAACCRELQFTRCPNVYIIIGERLSRKLIEASGGQFSIVEAADDSRRISKTT